MTLLKIFRNKIFIIFAVYTVSIILFATIYSTLPKNSFYHSTVQYEKEYFDEDVKKLSVNLTENLLIAIKKNIKNNFQIEDFYVQSISLADYPKIIKINYFISIKVESKTKSATTFATFDSIALNLQNYIIINDKPSVEYSHEKQKYFHDLLKPYLDYDALFEDQIKNHVSIDAKIQRKLISLGDAYRGFPKEISGHFLRMMYLSISVATTQAFGDILPITELSRVLVIIQNIFALVFLGFLVEASIELIKKSEA